MKKFISTPPSFPLTADGLSQNSNIDYIIVQ